jgi:uncharacterized cupredoxin-like copper-binding protein
MYRSRVALTCAAVAAATALTATAADARPAARGGSLTVTTRDYSVKISRLTIPHGVPISVTVVNAGKIVHEAVPELMNADDHPLRYKGKSSAIENIAPGGSKSGIWLFPKAGTYKIACHVKDHQALGMRIMVTVT